MRGTCPFSRRKAHEKVFHTVKGFPFFSMSQGRFNVGRGIDSGFITASFVEGCRSHSGF